MKFSFDIRYFLHVIAREPSMEMLDFGFRRNDAKVNSALDRKEFFAEH